MIQCRCHVKLFLKHTEVDRDRVHLCSCYDMNRLNQVEIISHSAWNHLASSACHIFIQLSCCFSLLVLGQHALPWGPIFVKDLSRMGRDLDRFPPGCRGWKEESMENHARSRNIIEYIYIYSTMDSVKLMELRNYGHVTRRLLAVSHF